MFLFKEETLLAPELAKPSYQFLLQGESIQTSLLSIQINKYETLQVMDRYWKEARYKCSVS